MSAGGRRSGPKGGGDDKTRAKARRRGRKPQKKGRGGPVVAEHDPDAPDPPEQQGAGGEAPEGPAPPREILLQDWTPLSQSLDWKLGRSAWAISADELFEDQRVPNGTHDSGTLSVRNARLLMVWCQEQDAAGALPGSIVVVEIGMGTGLHLRYLLDHFQALCVEAGVAYHERLEVYASDISTPLLHKARDRGLFDAHGDTVRLGRIDLGAPGIFHDLSTGERVDLRGKIHLCCANYVLDLLPFDVFRRRREEDGQGGTATLWEAVLVRTWLRAAERLPAYTELTLEQIKTLAASDDPQAWRALTTLYSLLQLEPRTFDVPIATHPDLDELVRAADRMEEALGPDHPLLKDGTVVYHSGGALRAALEMGRSLADNGYVILRDLALTTPEMAAVPRLHAHFGSTVAAGVNMVQLDAWFAEDRAGAGIRALAPRNDGRDNQAVRMLTRGALEETAARFAEIFDGEGIAGVERAIELARGEADPAAAMERYRLALQDEPGNWLLLGEAAACALARGLVPDLAIVIARQGLQVNPGYSPDLWNVYGDALWAAGDADNALLAYEAALQINPRHPRSHYCIAWLQAERGRFEPAFKHIGEALAHDAAGVIRGEVLQLLDVCLRGQRLAWEAEQERMATRAAR